MSDTEILDFMEKNLMNVFALTTPDMGGARFVGQCRNPAKDRGEAGASYLKIKGSSIRDAIERAKK